MKRFACRDIIPGCTEVFLGTTDQIVLDQVISHVAVEHGLVKPPLALVELVVATTQNVPGNRARGHLRLVGQEPTDPEAPPGADDGADPLVTRAATGLVQEPGDSAEVLALPVDRRRSRPTDAPMPSGSWSARTHESYRHDCLMYRGAEEFLASVTQFVRDGLTLDQPVMVAVVEPKLSALRQALGDDTDRVIFADMADIGRNPGLLMSAWRDFILLAEQQPIRGVGEPIWAERGVAEIVECQLHEALLNVAVDDRLPLWLICPYDIASLDDAIIAESLRSHSAVIDAGSTVTSRFYAGAGHATDLFVRPLPQPTAPVDRISLDTYPHGKRAEQILNYAMRAGLPAQRSVKLAAAVDEVSRAGLGNSGVRISLWQEDGAVVCDVDDPGVLDDPMIGRSATFAPRTRERGIWLANELCDLVQVRSNPAGTTVRVRCLL